ncbi:MAG: hypothetical protein COA79_16985 [Planctomycetota bacterium]|nr:MAG: hypothetical protein COA79_16985 [Planctomycetota bacterium]
MIPIRTNAPLNYKPYLTYILILINWIVCICQPNIYSGELIDYMNHYAVVYGDSLIPYRWVTACFVEINGFVLIVELFFLFIVGALVEGKVGYKKFLILYFGIGVFVNFSMQLINFGSDNGGFYGIFGILISLTTIAYIWAPEDEFVFFEYNGFREIKIKYFVNTMVLGVFILWVISGSADYIVAGIVGGVVGLLVGSYMVKKQLVDCDEWDIFSVRRRHRDPSFMPISKKEKVIKKNIEEELKGEVAINSINDAIEKCDFSEAMSVWMKNPFIQKNENVNCMSLIDLAIGNKAWEEAIQLVYTAVNNKVVNVDLALLRSAYVYITHFQQPDEALKVLKLIRCNKLVSEEKEEYEFLLQKAKELKRNFNKVDDSMELESRD